MKKVFLFLTFAAFVLSLALVSCEDGSGSGGGDGGRIPAELVAIWYRNQNAADTGGSVGVNYDYDFEITSDGKWIRLGGGEWPISVSGDTLLMYTSMGNQVQRRYNFTISGRELTLVDMTIPGGPTYGSTTKYYKRAN